MNQQEIVAEREYCAERLVDIGVEMKRLTEEGDRLKAELHQLEEDDPRAGVIRRRRRYLARRHTELKDERERVTEEREALVWQIKTEAETSAEPPHE